MGLSGFYKEVQECLHEVRDHGLQPGVAGNQWNVFIFRGKQQQFILLAISN